jgi:uncharacterized protein DUF6714
LPDADSGTVDTVRGEIREAFRGVVNPDKPARAHCPRCEDEADVQRLEFVQQWNEIPAETLFNMSLAFFSPAGFRFALPALMLHALDHPDSRGSEVDCVIWGLAPSSVWDASRSDEGARDKLRCLESLDAAQRAAVVAFLGAMTNLGTADEYMREDAAKALAWWMRTSSS